MQYKGTSLSYEALRAWSGRRSGPGCHGNPAGSTEESQGRFTSQSGPQRGFDSSSGALYSGFAGSGPPLARDR